MMAKYERPKVGDVVSVSFRIADRITTINNCTVIYADNTIYFTTNYIFYTKDTLPDSFEGIITVKLKCYLGYNQSYNGVKRLYLFVYDEDIETRPNVHAFAKWIGIPDERIDSNGRIKLDGNELVSIRKEY